MKNCERCNLNEATNAVSFKIENELKGGLYLCDDCSTKFVNEQKKNKPFAIEVPRAASFDELIEEALRNSLGGTRVMNRPNQHNKGGLLDELGTNITDLAEKDLLPPLSGREKEIERVIEILNRKNKNNPVLIGEPGVGKTAIIEGLAQRIISGDVSSKMQGKVIYSLNIASLVSDTGIRGQFESKMQKLIKELIARKNVILFIDEMHMMMGAGDPSGKMDVGNLLKPAMARGDIQVIGATTLKEFRQIEKDPALERRLEPIIVNEPTVEETIQILMTLKNHFENYHGVTYSDETIIACVEFADKYIQDRFMPDKAIDLMDISGSKMNLKITNDPLAKLRKRLRQLDTEKNIAVETDDFERAVEIRELERELEFEIMQAQSLVESKGTVSPKVPVEMIAEIIENRTGIPASKLTESEQEKVNKLHERLNDHVIGQGEAVKAVSKAVRRSRAGLKPKGKPVGSFLFVGPTGVGKTEMARKLAEELFGDEEAMIRLDMSEYMEKHAVSKLIGSPPGYVGFEDGGQLTDRVRRKPYSIILIDEIEKAHPDVANIFLQILEDGRLTDSHGKRVSFENTVIIATSNAGATQKKTNTLGFNNVSKKEEKTSLIETLKAYFRPELLNRFDEIVPFNHLSEKDLVKIVELSLIEVHEMLKEQKVILNVTEQAKKNLAQKGYNPSFGARELNRTIQKELVDSITDILLENGQVNAIDVRGRKDGNIFFTSK